MDFKDFLGNIIEKHDFCAYPGGGNAKAEYGLILYQVTDFDNEKKKIKARRLDVDYRGGAKIKVTKSTITNPNKLVVVKPPSRVVNAFLDYADDPTGESKDATVEEIGKWIHGQQNPFH